MIKVIPARMSNGQVVSDAPLPAAHEVRSVSILLEMQEPAAPPRESTLPRLLGILTEHPGNPRQEYGEYLEGKYR
ncbi:MAG: hypothetical protein JNM56_33910 [Planctomycetia bacterium]|nr:hypothetical protein [Planctomycetia bacterium]